MVGAAIKGVSKLLKKGKLKRPRGTPTKAAMMARKNVLRGETTAEKYKKTMGDPSKQLKKFKKKPLIGKTEKGIGIGVLGTLAYQKLKENKRVEAKSAKDKLQKAIDEKKKKDKERKKDAYGKRAPKKDKNYGGR